MALAPGAMTSYNLAPDANGLQASARQRLAMMLAQQGADTSPVRHWTEGAARVANALAGNYELYREDQKDEAEKKAGREAIAAFITGNQPQPTTAPQMPRMDPAAPPVNPPNPTTVPMANGRAVQVIEDGDTKPSPLDPPSGKDKDIAIRTIYGEDPGASAAGVAQVLRRRAIDGNFGGSNLTDVALAKGQFEPWSNPDARRRMESLSPDSPTYKRLEGVLSQAYAPEANDPTNGATHFFAPKAQAALGRDVPKWAQGPVTTMGPHAFYGGTGQPAPVQLAGPVPTPDSQQTAALPPQASPRASAQPPVQMAQADPQMRGGFVPDRKAALLPLLQNKYAAPFAQQMLMKEMEKEQNNVRPMTDRERKAWQVPEGMSAGLDSQGKPVFSPPQTNVNLNTAQKGQEAMTAKAVEDFQNSQKDAREAQKRVAIWDAMEQAAKGFEPGATAELRTNAKKYLKDVGLIEGQDVPDAQIFQMLQKQLQIHSQPKGQGAVSNYERELFSQAVANMNQDPAALQRAIQISRKLDQFDQAVAKVYRDNARKTGVPNAVEINDEIDRLGSPLSPADISFLNNRKQGTASAPASSGASGTTKSGIPWSIK